MSKFEKAVTDLVGDRTSGASELARRALEQLVETAEKSQAGSPVELRGELERFAAELAAARPSMAPIANRIAEWRKELLQMPVDSVDNSREYAARHARRLIEQSRNASRKIACRAAEDVAEGTTILTHSSSSTVNEFFEEVAGKGISAIVTESRPGMEGHATARRLAELGIPVTLITDAQMGLATKEADIAVCGADAILADGSVVNKSGTYLLALACREAGVPFWVLAESAKRSTLSAEEFPLEQSDPTELDAPEGNGIDAQNVTFDITPAELVTRWFDETGKR